MWMGLCQIKGQGHSVSWGWERERDLECYVLPFHTNNLIFLTSLPGTKVFVMPNGMLKSNQQLVDIIEKVKPEIRLLIEKCNTVRQGLVTCGLTPDNPA